MSMRDWYAGQALAGLLGNPGGPYQANDQCGWSITNCNQQAIAVECYGMADAMLAERDRK